MKRTILALAALVALTGCVTYQATPATTPAPPGGSGPVEATPVECSTAPPERDEPARLETGIARVSLCNDPGHAELYGMPGPTPPADALVLDADRVAAAYNALDRAELATMICTADMGPAYRLVVEYPDGRTVQLSGEMFGCHVVGTKVGSHTVLDAFTDALVAQRATLTPPRLVLAADAVCASPSSWVQAELADTTQGVLCTGFDAGARGEPIEGDAWQVVLADITANGREVTADDYPNDCASSEAVTLVGLTPWGEMTSLQRSCDLYTWQTGPDDGTTMGWTPGDKVKALLS